MAFVIVEPRPAYDGGCMNASKMRSNIDLQDFFLLP